MAIRRHPVLDTADLGAFDARTCALEDPRPHPTQDALVQLGTALMTELLDTLLGTALEDQAEVIAETFIGGLHAGAQRLERAADRQRDTMARRLREFDGSEVADHDLQDAKRAASPSGSPRLVSGRLWVRLPPLAPAPRQPTNVHGLARSGRVSLQ